MLPIEFTMQFGQHQSLHPPVLLFFYFQKFPPEKVFVWHEKNKMVVHTYCFYCFTVEQFPIECGKYDFGFALLCCVNGPEYLSHYFKHFSFSLECCLSALTL